ncbi:hypothetical protein BJX65DRAFT_285745 [Aspergillus insuetus]
MYFWPPLGASSLLETPALSMRLTAPRETPVFASRDETKERARRPKMRAPGGPSALRLFNKEPVAPRSISFFSY